MAPTATNDIMKKYLFFHVFELQEVKDQSNALVHTEPTQMKQDIKSSASWCAVTSDGVYSFLAAAAAWAAAAASLAW